MIKPKWYNTERRNWLAVVALAGLLGAALMNGHATAEATSHLYDRLFWASHGDASTKASCFDSHCNARPTGV